MIPNKKPTMLTIRETAKTGILPEHALRLLLKAGKLPAIFVGKKAYINYEKLCEQLSQLDGSEKPEGDDVRTQCEGLLGMGFKQLCPGIYQEGTGETGVTPIG
jgi:hypothetical protein